MAENYRISPSSIADDIPPLWYSESLIQAIEEANTANMQFGLMYLRGGGLWEFGMRLMEVARAHSRLTSHYSVVPRRGRHTMPRHLMADLVSVMSGGSVIVEYCKVESGMAALKKFPVAPVQKRQVPSEVVGA